MPSYRFTGAYEAWVTLPDGQVVLAQPDEVVSLDFDDPGPAWAPAPDQPTKPTVTAAQAAVAQAKAAEAAAEAELAAAETTTPTTTAPEGSN